MLVFDATPLIYLANVDRLHLLREVDEECLIPEVVYDEVVTAGMDAGHPDARRVEQAVDDGVCDVRSVDDTDLSRRLGGNPNLSEADVAVIAYSAENEEVAILDERYGRATAETEGVDTRGTVWILLSLVRAGHLAADEAREIVDEMIEAGWYCSTDLYTRIVRTLESYS
jgi:predicted nucleic acid-binding protein